MCAFTVYILNQGVYDPYRSLYGLGTRLLIVSVIHAICTDVSEICVLELYDTVEVIQSDATRFKRI